MTPRRPGSHREGYFSEGKLKMGSVDIRATEDALVTYMSS